MKYGKIGFLPQSRLGRWSAGLALGFILLNVLFVWLAVSQTLRGVSLGVDATTLGQILKIFLASVAAGALVTGVAGMIKSQERTVSIFVSIVVGILGVLGSLGI